MTATLRWLAFLAAVAVGLEAGSTGAGAVGGTAEILRGACLFGQATRESQPRLTRAEVDKLLADARRAIAAGDLARADALVTRAENSHVRYTIFHRDTPKRVRRDLEHARAKAQLPDLPSKRSQPDITSTASGARNSNSSTARANHPPTASIGSARRGSPAVDTLLGRAGSAGTTGSQSVPAWPFGNRAPGSQSLPPESHTQSTALAVGLENAPRTETAGARKAPAAGAAESPLATRKLQAVQWTRAARQALAQGDLATAQRLTQRAIALDVPDSAFAAGEDRPWLVALKIRTARTARGVVTADGRPAPTGDTVRQSVYASAVPAQAANQAHMRLAVGTQPTGKPATSTPPAQVDRLPAPTGSAKGEGNTAAKGAASLLTKTAQQQQVLIRKVSADVINRLSEARGLLKKEPKRSLQVLHAARTMVVDSGVPTDARAQLLRRIDRSIHDAEKYVQDHRAQIELDDKNRDVLEEIDRRHLLKVEVGQKLADLVEQFNQLRDEQRFEEMEVVAKRARELAPDEPIVQQLWREARFIRRIMNNRELTDRKENGVFQSLFAVEDAAVPPEDDVPYKHPDAKIWEQLSKSRARRRREGGPHRTKSEQEIERKLQSPVMLQFSNTPLSEVIDQLMRLAAVNIHLDERGLAEEGLTTNEPVTIHLNGEISLKSALNLILEPLHLSYVVKDEVLKITSENLRDGEVFTRTYDVADLVIPIPNFVPGSHFGLQGAINDAQAALSHGAWSGGGFAPPMALIASRDGSSGKAMINPQLLAQGPGASRGTSGGPAAPGMPFASGPGGLGGGAQADFDSLIDLIQTTIEPDSWEDTGGAGSISPFETNLSLVISQTQDVHEKIVDLLEQLRRLQDLQVTIEVRFITLSDSFFERIGVDFDFNIVKPVTTDINNRPVSPSATVGLTGTDPPQFTADLDIPFSQGSFAAANPVFGGFDPNGAANFGFAILSDIEAFFLIQAAQGDSRSNVLQAPKVTLFNGQQAFVSDTSNSPFVISVIPVVGDFAAAQQPVIVVLSEGTSLSVQAVVSPDRRYVRLTVVPFFSQIGDVKEFTFEGTSSTTKKSSSAVDETDDSVVSKSNDDSEVRQGTTVQLPTFALVTVATTVSVPDGGTVLLGGIKRLKEGRSEIGVPLLSKIPYVDRLFRNVGIGRETESLMMMVTPRIIIQEEEEERLLGVSSE